MTQRRYQIEKSPEGSLRKWTWLVYDGTGEKRAQGYSNDQDEAERAAKTWIEKNPERKPILTESKQSKVFRD